MREGGGLVVVGGQDAYDLGDYRNSSLEEFLPVRSTPSIFEGGKTLIFVLDISFSLLSTRTGDGTPLLDYEKALAVELLKSPHFRDYKVGLIVFGTKAYDVLDPIPLSRAESVLRGEDNQAWRPRARRTAIWIAVCSWPGICSMPAAARVN